MVHLVGAVLSNDEWTASDPGHLSDGSMAKLYPARNTDAVAGLKSGV